MTNPDKTAAFADLSAELDPRITLTVDALVIGLHAGMPEEMVFQAAIQALHSSYDSTEMLAAIAALTMTRMAQIDIAVRNHMAERHGQA